MTISQSYNSWADQYDTNENKTRDLEKIAAKQTLDKFDFKNVIELGCGTGKNTQWLAEKAATVIGLDFSTEMLKKAKEKIKNNNVTFQFADLNSDWQVTDNSADLVTCSLVLEHIDNLRFIFSQASKKLRRKGLYYICELHPFKQYSGTKARYTEGETLVELEVFIHHISDYTNAALEYGFKIIEIKEWFDGKEKNELPRLISFVFQKE